MKITANKREIAGKKVKKLRSEGQVPASIYGPHRESLNVALDGKAFTKIFHSVGFNKLFDLEIAEENKTVKALVKEVQFDPVTDQMYNVSLYEIDMSKKVTVNIPFEIVGVSPAVKNNLGFLVTPMEVATVVCLPSDIPAKLVVDISGLENVNDAVHIGDLKLPENVEWAHSMIDEQVVASVTPPQKEIVVEEAPAETAEGETAEGEEAAAGEGDAAKTEEAGK